MCVLSCQVALTCTYFEYYVILCSIGLLLLSFYCIFVVFVQLEHASVTCEIESLPQRSKVNAGTLPFIPLPTPRTPEVYAIKV